MAPCGDVGESRFIGRWLISDLKGGFPLADELRRSGNLEAVAYPPLERTKEELRRGRQYRNADMMRRVRRARAAAPSVERAVVEGSEAEVQNGKGRWCDLEQARRSAVLTPRFGVDEGFRVKKGKRSRKVRVIDDFLASLVKSACAAGGRMRHDTLDVLVGLLQLYWGCGKPPRMRKDDFTGAYKTLPIRSEHLDLAVAIMLGPEGLRAGAVGLSFWRLGKRPCLGPGW